MLIAAEIGTLGNREPPVYFELFSPPTRLYSPPPYSPCRAGRALTAGKSAARPVGSHSIAPMRMDTTRTLANARKRSAACITPFSMVGKHDLYCMTTLILRLQVPHATQMGMISTPAHPRRIARAVRNQTGRHSPHKHSLRQRISCSRRWRCRRLI